jgi:DNA-binding response OmpR family regulator
MPHMNGFEVLEQIRQDDSFREVLVIMLTAEKQLDSIVKGYCTGANVYLTKPVDPAAILKLIES